MEYDFDGKQKDSGGVINVVRMYLGVALILVGVYLACKVAFTAFDMIAGEEPPAIIARFTGLESKLVLEGVEGSQQLVASQSLVDVMVYGLGFLLLLVAGSVAGALLRTGSYVLAQGDGAELLKRLVEKLRGR